MSGLCIAVIVSLPGFADADRPLLELPVDCEIARTCWLVNLVDTASGPGHRDYRCGPLGYDNHRGTDIAIANKRVMDAGLAVLAAAGGTIIGVRDGVPETTSEMFVSGTGIRGRECGNGVMIRHQGDWTTQYCHMKADSIGVKKGDTVDTGDRLGEIGLSGRTQFPHIHLTVRNGDIVIDPFTGYPRSTMCDPDGTTDGGLWSPKARKALAYPGPQPFHLGFATGKPDIQRVRAGELTQRTFSPDVPALTFWAEIYTLRKDDVIDISLIGPERKIIHQSRIIPDRPQARRYGFVGRKRPPGGWPTGTYTGRVEVSRGTSSISMTATASVE